MVICPSDGIYNHLIYFEEKQKFEDEPQDMLLVLDVFGPKLLFLS